MSFFHRFIKNQSGQFTLPMVAMVVPMMFGMAGTFDYSRVFFAEIQLGNSLDLATSNFQNVERLSNSDKRHIRISVKANYNSEFLSIKFVNRNKQIRVTASDQIETPFLAMIGQDKANIVVSTRIDRSRW